MPATYTGYGGVPYLSKADADASFARHSSLTSTDPRTGITYPNEAAMLRAQSEERQRNGW